MIEMDSKEVEELAFDVACAFFKDDQLCTRYDLKLHQLKEIKSHRAFQSAVLEVQRLLNDDGSEFVIAAKKASMDVLKSMQAINNDTQSTDNSRIKAGQAIWGMAKLLHTPSKDAGGSGTGSIIINTNLQLNQEPSGVYTIEATAEPEEKLIEYVEDNEIPLIENGDLL